MTLDEFKATLPKGYRGRPMLAKYEADCGWCGQAVLPGDPVLWMPDDKCVFCQCCARDEGASA